MEDIYTILSINKSLIQNFPLKANNLVDHQTELDINRNVRTLKEVEERMMSDRFVKVPQQTIDEIIQKVIDNAKANNQNMSIWSIRELRIVSYYLMKLQGNDKAYIYALTLLKNNWRNIFFNGLSFYCLDTWNMIDPKLRVYVCELLRNKFLYYKDGNKKYMTMKNRANLFDEAGPLRMSAMISQKRLDIKDAPSLFNNKPSTIQQSYYSDVIVNYCNTNYIMDIDLIESIFNIHNLERTKKLVLADFVERINNNGDEVKRTQICKFVNRILGDVTLSTTWAPFLGATEQDAKKLRRAKELVNQWFNQRIIETFFEVCVPDRDRKEFWLNYISSLDGFRIVGSSETKRLLQSDSRISGMFSRYFIETDSISYNNSALVFFIKNKMLVEFSSSGALYVYNSEHKMVRTVLDRKNHISKTDDLKQTSMGNLININDWGTYTINEEGRMAHIGYWQIRLKTWIQNKVLSSSTISTSSFASKDNELFQAKPIPKEEFSSNNKFQKTAIKVLSREEQKEKQHITIQQTPKKPKQQQINPQKTASLKPVVYEENIQYSIASKWILDNKCKVVLNKKGFYIYISRIRKFVNVCDLTNSHPSGYIWIKRPNMDNWQTIIHVLQNKESTIGFVKEAGGGILFKQELSQSDFMHIKL